MLWACAHADRLSALGRRLESSAWPRRSVGGGEWEPEPRVSGPGPVVGNSLALGFGLLKF